VRHLFAAALLLAIVACDPQLNMSDGPTTRTTVEGCSDAVAHLKTCCPAYDSYLSCTLFENARNFNATPDLSASQGRCLRKKTCDEIERAVSGDHSICDWSSRTRVCK
jgi:hypothetical protein